MKPRLAIPIIIVTALVAGFFVYPAALSKLGVSAPSFFVKDFKFGLDIRGGTHLVYQADVSQIPQGEQTEAMEGLKDVIERRVNLFGVAEPVINVNKVGNNQRLIVELAGVLDVNEAISIIGQTPFLEFKEQRPPEETEAIIQSLESQNLELTGIDPFYTQTPLTGRYLNRAQLSFAQQTGSPEILIEFNDEGTKIFAELTKKNLGKPLAIYLDDALLSAPIVQSEITSGNAQITGNFSIEEAKTLVRDLNAGALPVPIELISQQTVGATLGADSLSKSLVAGLIGFTLVALFMIIYYRLAGVVAVIALAIYTIIVLTVFKLFSFTLTLAGIVGFILSVGMAVDANILIFERMKEELREGKSFKSSMEEGFKRAWTAIRDAYTSTLMTAVVLYWFGTSLVRGFALTLGLGLLVSLFSAVILTKTFLRAFAVTRLRDVSFLWRH